jgi:putative aminopeptidase FrvX
LTFSHNGCSQYAVKATGGGYDWTYYGRTLTIYTCEGENFDGCITKPKCGDSSIFTN